ncbi:MFS transporter [Flavobacteriaceae bacterium]|nr:MFS transporter [Flavobacteriaceae bacterium]
MSRKQYFKNFTLLVLCGEAIFFLPFVIVRIFRPTVLQAFEINNTELGYAFSIYGIIALGAYFFGGIIADRFPVKTLISISLIATGVLGLFMAEMPSYKAFILIYALWGITTLLLFWSPMKKAIRILGGKKHQGGTFGGIEAGRGLTAALLGSLILLLFVDTNTDSSAELMNIVYRYTSIFIIVMGILIALFLDIDDNVGKNAKAPITNLRATLKLRTVWQQMFFVLAAYVAYKCTDDFSLYAHDVLGFNDQESGIVGTLTLYVRPIAAVSLGLLADRFSVRLMSLIGFGLTSLGSILFYLLDFQSLIIPFFLNLMVLSIGIYSLRALYYAIMNEAKIPLSLTGTAVGVVSFVGYTPDIFMGPIMGYFLDDFPGLTGHQYVFGFCSVFALIGFVNLYYFPKNHKKAQ